MMQAGGLPHVLAAPATDPTLSDFNQLIWWMVLLKVAIVFLFLLLTTIFMIWAERRVIGRMQNRPGPNRAGPFGLLQPIADALKLPLKEDIIPTGRGQAGVHRRAGDIGGDRLHQLLGHPVGPGSLDLPPPHPAAARRPAGGGAAHPGDELDRRVRDRAGRLVLGVALFAARGAAFRGAGNQLRDRDGPGLRGRVPLRGLAVYHRHRQCAAARMVRVAAAGLVRDLPGHHGRRDQPAAVRPARGRGRAGGRLSHRVLVDEVRDVLPRRVHQHDHGLRTRDDDVPRRLAGAVAAVAVVGREQRLVAAAVVPDQGLHLACSASSGCAARCPGSGTTSSWRSAGRSSSRSPSSGSC